MTTQEKTNHSKIQHNQKNYCDAMEVSLTRSMNVHHLINLKRKYSFNYCDYVVLVNSKLLFNKNRRSLTMNI